jgi:hypothetical protein
LKTEGWESVNQPLGNTLINESVSWTQSAVALATELQVCTQGTERHLWELCIQNNYFSYSERKAWTMADTGETFHKCLREWKALVSIGLQNSLGSWVEGYDCPKKEIPICFD